MPSPTVAATLPEAPAVTPGADAPIDSAFAHTLAHDMRTPLTAIQMCAEVLATRDDPQMRVRYATVIAEQAHAMAWALENLVALADRLDLGQGCCTCVDLMELARLCAADLHSHAEARSVGIVIPPRPDRLDVPGCDWAISQSIRGCLQVLVALTPAGGEVRVTGTVADGEAHLRMLLVAPRDSVPQSLAALDLPWHRLSLLTAAKLIREHGGRVMELSEPAERGIAVILPHEGQTKVESVSFRTSIVDDAL